MPGEKAAPFVAMHITKRGLQPTITNKTVFRLSEPPVRWPGKTGGAIRFSLIFLFLFLSRKKENKMV
jgi:hypothetical protein